MADQDIPNGAADPGMLAFIKGHVDPFVMGLTFATGGTAGNVEMIEVLTREVLGLGKPLFECGLNNV